MTNDEALSTEVRHLPDWLVEDFRNPVSLSSPEATAAAIARTIARIDEPSSDSFIEFLDQYVFGRTDRLLQQWHGPDSALRALDADALRDILRRIRSGLVERLGLAERYAPERFNPGIFDDVMGALGKDVLEMFGGDEEKMVEMALDQLKYRHDPRHGLKLEVATFVRFVSDLDAWGEEQTWLALRRARAGGIRGDIVRVRAILHEICDRLIARYGISDDGETGVATMTGRQEFERIARDFYLLEADLEGLTEDQLVDLVIGNVPFERYRALLDHLDEVLAADASAVADALFQAGARYSWNDPRQARDLVTKMRDRCAAGIASGEKIRPDLRAMGLLPPLPDPTG